MKQCDNTARCNPKNRPFVRPPWCRERLVTVIEGESATDRSHGNQTDVNAIVERFKRTGILPPPTKQGQYMDCTGLQGDLTELINKSREAIRSLEELQQQQLQQAQNPGAQEASAAAPTATAE